MRAACPMLLVLLAVVSFKGVLAQVDELQLTQAQNQGSGISSPSITGQPANALTPPSSTVSTTEQSTPGVDSTQSTPISAAENPPSTVSAPPSTQGSQPPATGTAGSSDEESGLLPGAPNGGLIQYVALAAHNFVPGLVVPNTQFGVPFVEFTATHAALNKTASFHGASEVAVVQDGAVQYPFRPNKRLSPECQVVVHFVAFDPRAGPPPQ